MQSGSEDAPLWAADPHVSLLYIYCSMDKFLLTRDAAVQLRDHTTNNLCRALAELHKLHPRRNITIHQYDFQDGG